MKKQQIVHVLSVFPSKSETFIINVIIASIKKGIQSLILSNQIVALKNSSQPQLLQEYNLFQTAQTVPFNVPENKIARILKALLFLLKKPLMYSVFLKSLDKKKYGARATSLKLWYQVATFMQYSKNTVFHGHFGVNGVLLAEMKAIGAIKGKIIVSFYGYDTFSTLENRVKIQDEYKQLFEIADAILVNSNYLKSNLQLLNAPEEKIKMIHVGVDTALFPFVTRKSTSIFKMITVGRLINLKGQHLGIEVVAKLKEKGYNVQYAIIGDGVEMETLQQKVNALNLQNEILLLGAKTQVEIKNLFNTSDLFLMTSITDVDGRAEGQGLVTAEAQATGLPVVAFDSGGVGETIVNGETGYLVADKDVLAMSIKVENLIEDASLRTKMSTNARILVEDKFDNKKQVKQVIDYCYE